MVSLKSIKIALIDADLLDNGTRHPNLALMKISNYCKKDGHQIDLIIDDINCADIFNYNLIIISKVFNYTKNPNCLINDIPTEKMALSKINTSILEAIKTIQSSKNNKTRIIVGGTGFFPDGGKDLDYAIEHSMPDYSLYDNFISKKVNQGKSIKNYDDYLNYSIGFTTRGCFRKCSFCVNQKYNSAFRHSPVKEFLDSNRPKIYLWDDNFFAFFDGWEEILEEIVDTGKPFQFRQGLDIRLMTEKHAEKLSRCKYNGDFIFAFDHVEDKELIEKKLKIWRKHSNRGTKLYVLCAYDPWFKQTPTINQDEKDQIDIAGVFERIEILMKYKCIPYIMRYEKYKDSKYRGMYIQIARWCNQPRFFKKMSFREFCEANQSYHSGRGICSAIRAMAEFENDCPEVAKKYFDMKYEKRLLNN